MNGPQQTIIVPVVAEVPHTAIAYAEMLSKAYDKPIALLCFTSSLLQELETYPYPITSSESRKSIDLNTFITTQDAVMIIFETVGKRRIILQQLSACRQLRIPYFFIPKGCKVVLPRKVVLPMSFLIEDREKATWGRSLHRYFKSQFTILKPKDKGSRARKNVDYVATFYDKWDIPYTTIKGKKSSFKNDREALALLSGWASLFIVTASREYGLDDHLLGPKEMHVIRKSTLPIMILNPRDDLYILCGD